MKIFLDFDNTLLDTRAIVRTRYKPFLVNVGIPLDRIDATFGEFASGVDPAKESFSIEKHLNALGVEKDKQSEYLPHLEKIFEQPKEFLFPGARDFLRALFPHELILLSFGDFNFQNLKIEASHLKEFFSEICITKKSKEDEISARIGDDKKSVFIDDHGEYFEGLKQKFDGRVSTIHFLHPETQYTCSGCPADLHTGAYQEIIEYIKTICVAS